MIRFYYTLIFLNIVIWPSYILGTPQTPDELLINGVKHQIYGFELSATIQKHFQEYRKNCLVTTTANWDGFYAELHLKDKKLYLMNLDADVTIRLPDCPTIETRDVFGIEISQNGIFTDWFSGELHEYFGKPFISHSMSNIRIFTFEKGILIKISEKENELYREYMDRLKEEDSNS